MKNNIVSFLIALAVIASAGVQASAANFPKRFESVTLYSEAQHKPNPDCDRGTTMTIDYVKKTALLREFVSGACELYAAPNERTYRLSIPEPGLGSVTMTGRRKTELGMDRIEIVDHRMSLLPVVYEAMWIVTETLAGGSENKLFSSDEPRVVRPGPDKMQAVYNCKLDGRFVSGAVAVVVRTGGGGEGVIHHDARVTKIVEDMRMLVSFPLLKMTKKLRKGVLVKQIFSTMPNADESMSLTLDITRLVKDREGMSAHPSILEFENRRTDMLCRPVLRPQRDRL